MDFAVPNTIPFGFRPSLHSQGLPFDYPFVRGPEFVLEESTFKIRARGNPTRLWLSVDPPRDLMGTRPRIRRPDPLDPGLGP